MKFVLENIRSSWNVGSIMRTADALGMGLVLIGYTPRPAGATLPMVAKTAIGAEKKVEWEHFDLSAPMLERYSSAIHLGIEISPGSQNIFDFIQNNELRKIASAKQIEPGQLTQNIYLWLGNEISGLSPSLLFQLDGHLHLPMKGIKESLNVSSCACAVGYLMEYSMDLALRN
jgi:23S rRNA (guanosine2251-2'-O)-methyltransferase